MDILSGRYVTHGPPNGFERFSADYLPATIERVSCKGKFIFMSCSSPAGQASIWSTLGMSGRWALQPSKHTRVCFSLWSEGRSKQVYYTDPRNFGTLTFCMDQGELERKLESIGPAYLSGEVTALDFIKIARKSPRRYAAVFLMDQSKTSGIGNYILSEAFYRSVVDPFLKIGDLSDQQLLDLHTAIMEIITESYASFGVSRGATKAAPPIGMFRGLDNNAGSYASQLQVYGRAECPKGRPVITEVGPHKRAIWYVADQLTPAGISNRQALGLTDMEEERVYLKVPFSEKDEAKQRGAKWDARAKRWYAPAGSSADKLSKWL